LHCDWKAESGAEVLMVLPGTDQAVAGRVIRAAEGGLGLAFRQDAETLAVVDRAQQHIAAAAMRGAA
jgi:hypothetical protein